jgi:hypothetical protein
MTKLGKGKREVCCAPRIEKGCYFDEKERTVLLKARVADGF